MVLTLMNIIVAIMSTFIFIKHYQTNKSEWKPATWLKHNKKGMFIISENKTLLAKHYEYKVKDKSGNVVFQGSCSTIKQAIAVCDNYGRRMR